MKHYCFMDNVTTPTKNGLTAYRNRFRKDFKGKLVPFAACVDYKPTNPRDIDDMPALGSKMRGGILIGYHLHAGGKWSGDYVVLDIEQLEEAERISDVKPRRIKEIIIKDLGGDNPTQKFHFSNQNRPG